MGTLTGFPFVSNMVGAAGLTAAAQGATFRKVTGCSRIIR